MAEIKFTKNELRAQQAKLSQLERYLPTLQLKKAMLQSEVNDARHEIMELEKAYQEKHKKVETYCQLLSAKTSIDPLRTAIVQQIHRRWENIAGVEVPYYEGVDFEPLEYSLFDTPPWVDGVVLGLRGLAEGRAQVQVVEEKKAALEEELRQVTIRVNLFEKILIPRSKDNIKRIKVFLGDQELAAVSQAKVAKGKIEAKKAAKLCG